MFNSERIGCKLDTKWNDYGAVETLASDGGWRWGRRMWG